jgi:hypothetical protein
MAILDLATHPWAYVTVGELADYWRVSAQQVMTYLASGAFEGINLGPGVYRIRTSAALDFERRSNIVPQPDVLSPAAVDDKAVKRVLGPFRPRGN